MYSTITRITYDVVDGNIETVNRKDKKIGLYGAFSWTHHALEISNSISEVLPKVFIMQIVSCTDQVHCVPTSAKGYINIF